LISKASESSRRKGLFRVQEELSLATSAPGKRRRKVTFGFPFDLRLTRAWGEGTSQFNPSGAGQGPTSGGKQKADRRKEKSHTSVPHKRRWKARLPEHGKRRRKRQTIRIVPVKSSFGSGRKVGRDV